MPLVVGAFCFGVAWLSALVGVTVRNAETASAATFFITIPLTFLSSTFVPVETMPGWLQAFAEGKPHHPRRKPVPQHGTRRTTRIIRMDHHLMDRVC